MNCTVCRNQLDPALPSAGIYRHPNCDRDKPLTREQVRDAIALLVTRLGGRK